MLNFKLLLHFTCYLPRLKKEGRYRFSTGSEYIQNLDEFRTGTGTKIHQAWFAIIIHNCINRYTVAIEMWMLRINNTSLNDWHSPMYATEIAHNSTSLQFCQTNEDYSFIVNIFSAWHYFNFASIRLFFICSYSIFFPVSIPLLLIMRWNRECSFLDEVPVFKYYTALKSHSHCVENSLFRWPRGIFAHWTAINKTYS